MPKTETVRAADAELPYVGLDCVESTSTRVLGYVDYQTIRGSAKRFSSGDTLYARLRPYLNKVCAPEVEGIASTEFIVLPQTAAFVPRYLLYLLNSPDFVEFATRGSEGIERPRLSWQRMSKFPFALPPLAEQRRIVAEIEEHLSLLEACEAQVQRAIQRSLQLRREVLRRVVPDSLPANWRVSTVAGIGVADLGRQRAPQFHHGAQMRPYLRVANVLEDRLDLSDVMEMDFPGDQAERYRLKPGDILLNEGQTPELVGRPAMFRGEIDELCFSKTLLRFRAGPAVDSNFALLVFLSYLHSGRFRREARITTNIGHMVLARFKQIEFPLPPMAEQKEVVNRVRAQVSKIDNAQSELAAGLKKVSSLRRAILARAFRGELVPQDPNDEPASVLLERIAAAPPSAPTPTRKRKERAPA